MGFKTLKKLFLSGLFIILAFPVLAEEAKTGSAEGYKGVPWGTTLEDFKAMKGARIIGDSSFGLDSLAAKAIDYLMMDFHEIGAQDPRRPVKFSAGRLGEDGTTFVFYGGKLSLACTPLGKEEIDQVQKTIQSKYKPGEKKSLVADWGITTNSGTEYKDLDFIRYPKSKSTRIYLVKSYTYYDYGGYQGPWGGYLIYASEDYFGNNAYMEWEQNKKKGPELEKKEKDEQKQKVENLVE